jgi:hypothetical protein
MRGTPGFTAQVTVPHPSKLAAPRGGASKKAHTRGSESVIQPQAYLRACYYTIPDCNVVGAYGLTQGWWRSWWCHQSAATNYYACLYA